MEWWGWLLLAFAFSRAWRWRAAAYRHGWHRHGWDRSRMPYGMRSGWGPGPGMIVMGGSCGRRHRAERVQQAEAKAEAPAADLSPAQKRERAVVDLRRRYVADEITVEQYEEGLDRILKGD